MKPPGTAPNAVTARRCCRSTPTARCTTSAGARLRPRVADRRRRPAFAASARRSAQSTAISSIPGKSRCRSCCRTMRPTSFSAPTIAAATVAVSQGRGRQCRPRRRHRVRGNYSSRCSPRFAHKLADERRIGTSAFALTGGAIPVGGRLRSIGRLGRYRRAARRRCRRPHQSGHRRRHRLGGAVGRARRARGGRFACRSRARARRL